MGSRTGGRRPQDRQLLALGLERQHQRRTLSARVPGHRRWPPLVDRTAVHEGAVADPEPDPDPRLLLVGVRQRLADVAQPLHHVHRHVHGHIVAQRADTKGGEISVVRPESPPQTDGMRIVLPPAMPAPFQALATRVVEAATADPRITGVVVGGSVATGTSDAYSDLDLVIACRDEDHASVLADAPAFAADVGPVLAAFTGEHVGERRLLIVLYGPPPLHVDLKFVSVSDLSERVEDGIVLWQRGRSVDEARSGTRPSWPQPEPQWIEDRFWVWIHYVAAKIARGEIFEAVDGLTMIRGSALAPLATFGRTDRPAGVRRLETLAPEYCPAFAATIAAPTAADCTRALRSSIDLYLQLRDESSVVCRRSAQSAVLDYVVGGGP